MDKHSLTAWPQVIHPNIDWIVAYTQGWTVSAPILGKESIQVNDGRLRWTIFCTRYAWPHWPIVSRLDDLYRQPATLVETDPPLSLLEWEVYQLSGDEKRLAQCFTQLQQWTNEALLQPSASAPLQQVISLQSLSWIAKKLDQAETATVYQRQAREICADLSAIDPVDRELALLWADYPNARTDKTFKLLRQALARPSLDNREQAWGIERCLLLLAALRRQQEVEWAAAVADFGLTVCVDHASLYGYIPPFFIDGIVGCVPLASDGSLSWWLSQTPPIGVIDYPLGDGRVSLHATQEAGAGTLLAVQNSAPLLLEVVTPERSYVEALAAGHHRLILTVLDRTDVKRI